MSIRSSAPLVLGVVFCLLPAALLTPPAVAQPEQEQAKEHYKRGRAYHDLGLYEEAIQEYLIAYELSKAPKLLFNLAQVHRLSGDLKAAARYYKLYVESEPDGKLSQAARTLLNELRTELRKQAQEAEKPQQATEAQQAEQSPQAKNTAQAETPPQAEAVVRQEEENRPKPRAEPRVAQRPRASETVREAAPARGSRVLRIVGITTSGAGLIALGFGGKYAWDARSLSDELHQQPLWSDELSARVQDGEAKERTMKLLYGVGAATLITGGVLYYLGARSTPENKPRRVVVVPAVHETGSSLFLIGRY